MHAGRSEGEGLAEVRTPGGQVVMAHKHKKAHHPVKHAAPAPESAESRPPRLELVLKADSVGSVEAVSKSVSAILLPQVEIAVIQSGVGDVNKSDILMAETGSGLIAGFQVDVLPGMSNLLREHRVEVRLYEVIYNLTADVRGIAETLVPPVSDEQVIGSAKVVALFKSSRRGIIIGCEVRDGFLAVGQRFRIISAMGPLYSATVESLHVGEKSIQKAAPGQAVGIKIRDFNKAHIGDIVETFRPIKKTPGWHPAGEIIRK